MAKNKVREYKTAAGEIRAMYRRFYAVQNEILKETEGMTNQEKADHMNKRGREAKAQMRMEAEKNRSEESP